MSKMQCKNCLSLCAQRAGNVMRKLRNLEQNLMSDYFFMASRLTGTNNTPYLYVSNKVDVLPTCDTK